MKRPRLSYGNVMATIALFVALGGGAYAATQPQRNSVGAKQLKKNAVTSAKVKDGSLRAADFGQGQLPQGPKGDAGAKGDVGKPGPPGEPGAVLTTLPPGRELKGIFSLSGTYAEGIAPSAAISFQIPLATPPAVRIVSENGSEECPGFGSAPEAEPGYLCVYDRINIPVAGKLKTESPTRYGTVIFVEVTKGQDYDLQGTWAVNAG